MNEANSPAQDALEDVAEAIDPPSTIYDDNALTKVHPNYRTQLRIGAVITSVILLFPILGLELILMGKEVEAIPRGAFAIPAVLLLALMIFRLPRRRYDAMGFAMSEDRLRVARGIWFRSDTVVPFGRVQHLDVQRGPLERLLGLSTLVLHTAGNHNASVSLPGLEEEQAITMREEIREHIKRQTV